MAKKSCKPKTFVIGDLHGAFNPLLDVITRTNVNPDTDKIIFIGDIADKWDDFDKCAELLLSFKNFVPVIGNHDLFIMEYLKYGTINEDWVKCGGASTIEKIVGSLEIQNLLKKYFDKAVYFHVESDKIFLHGGFNPRRAIDAQKRRKFAQNRNLYTLAKTYHVQNKKIPVTFEKQPELLINEIFIGHSSTKNSKPHFVSNLINIDTGVKANGVLTIMDIYSKDYIQSKPFNFYSKK